MLQLLSLLNLAMFATVVSQPLFYAVALGSASRALSAPAYVELRNAINAVMKRRIPALYLATLATSVALLAASVAARDAVLVGTTAVAAVALVADATLMLRESVRINAVIETWTPADYPPDWQAYRARWFAVFSIRQLLACGGFGSLLVGAVLR